MREWSVDISVDFGGGRRAVCHATLFAKTAGAARRDGRQLLEAVCRDSSATIAGITVGPSSIRRPMTVSPVRGTRTADPIA